MRIYWYWPFAREEDIALAYATPGTNDTLTVHALDRPGAPRESRDRVTIRAELPDVGPARDGSLRWAASRVNTYVARARMRHRTVATGAFDIGHVAFLNQYTDIADLRLLARRTRLVTTVHDVVPHRSRLPHRTQRQILTQLYRACGTIVVHHEDVGSELVARFDVPVERVHVVPHWVSPFRDADDHRARSDQPTVLFFGTFRQNKGIPVLLDAIRQLGADSTLRFHIAGRGDADLEHAVLAAAERTPQLTAEVGWITPKRKAELFRAADLTVLPYTAFSSQSGVLHDAFGNHLPAIVSDVGALRASVERTGAGWWVPPGSADALATAIADALADPVRWQSGVDGARRVAIDQAPGRVGAALRSVYAAALELG